MTKQQIPHEQISKLAADIRVIRDFTSSVDFDTAFLSAQITTTPASRAQADWPLIAIFAFIALLTIDIATIVFVEDMKPKTTIFLFVLGIGLVTLSTISIHKKFTDITITSISAIGLILALAVGFGIYTPKEATELVQQLNPKKP